MGYQFDLIARGCNTRVIDPGFTVHGFHNRPARIPFYWLSNAERNKRQSRILLVEDNPVNQKVALIHLRKFGYTADIATNGMEALKAIERDPYDLVLMDVQMPVMGGYEATQAIRKRHTGSSADMPIIAMTANAMKGDREKCIEAGMNDYIAKPIDPCVLQEKIEQWSGAQ